MEFFHWVQVILNNYGALLLKGTGVTILLAIVGTAVGFVIGLLIGIYKTIPIRPEDPLVKRVLYKVVNFLLSAYIELFRSTPMMVQAMVIYYGAGFLFSLRLNPVTAGMFIISINTGAYMAEIVRGGIISVDKGQFEATHSIGMTHFQSMLYVVLPQAIRNILPATGNQFIINIKDSFDGMMLQLEKQMPVDLTKQTRTNLPARLRMAATYAVAQSMNGRVANTCNLSEDWVGYSTRYGDSVGDFSPMSNLTVTEVKEIGHLLGLPAELVEKTPIDGLCGKTDEENLGFTYAELDVYIRTGEIANEKTKELIDKKHRMNLFKLQLMPSFIPE